jgi:glyoxylase-like metal-dependent hydrolase (beta-lactamase superfamily II)
MRFVRRRTLLKAAVGGAAAVGLGVRPSRFARAQVPTETALRAEALRGNVLQLEGGGGNVVLLGAPAGVAMIDCGSPEHGRAVQTFVAERFGGAPVEWLFNTHWHLEHTGGNEAVARSGTRIVAHENTRLWMSTEFFVDWQSRTYEPRPPAARPTQTFYSSDLQPIELEHGGERIQYGLLREAHTDGDIYVRLLNQNVIVAGGAATAGEYPTLDYITGGQLGGLIAATQSLIDMSDGETLIVPARGPALRRRDLEAQRDMVVTVRDRMQRLARQGKSAKEMLAEGITREFDERWGGDPELFVVNAYRSLWGLGP